MESYAVASEVTGEEMTVRDGMADQRENSRRRAQWLLLAGFCLPCISCGPTKLNQPPEVLGIAFGSRVSELRGTALANDAKAENYILIPFHGYKLQYPNPENWTVFVADSAPGELEDQRIYGIALTRDLGRDCVAIDRHHLAEQLQALHGKTFATQAVIEDFQGEETAAVMVSDRRLLYATARCFVRSVSVVLGYMDLDLYSYTDTLDAAKTIEAARRTVTEYASRTLGK